MPTKSEPPPSRWRIISKRAGVLGTVEARTAEEAIEVAAERFGITDPERRKRLTAIRIA